MTDTKQHFHQILATLPDTPHPALAEAPQTFGAFNRQLPGRIRAYTPPEGALKPAGNFDPAKPLFTALKAADIKAAGALEGILDDITVAVESGYVHPEGWPQQLFANKLAYKAFLNALCGQKYVAPRQAAALAKLATGSFGDPDLRDGAQITFRLEEHCNFLRIAVWRRQ